MKDKNSIYIFVFCVLLLIFLTRGFEYVLWRSYVRQAYEAIPAFLFLGGLRFYYKAEKHRLYFSSTVLYLCIYPIVLILLKPLVFGTGLFDLLLDVPVLLGWTSVFVLYFIFSYYNISENVIVNILLTFGLITFILQIWQQLNPHIPLFGISSAWMENHENEIASVRNDIYRLFIGSCLIQMFCLFYYCNRLLKKVNVKNLILFSVFLISVYLYLTRQVLIVIMISMFMSVFQSDNLGVRKWKKLLIFSILGAVSVIYWDNFFNFFVQDYKDNTYTTDIRWEAAIFFVNRIIQNPITLLLGHGYQYQSTEITAWASKGYYLSDIGFIGECYYFGIIWIIVFFRTIYEILFKYANLIPVYIKMFVLAVSLDSVMIFPYRNGEEAFVWVSVMYISSLYINRKRTKCV